MYFKKITMHGFKSFADPVTIEFDKGITCIVGPNGSGKSNISDAIRWVLGEQSPKMLRGGKMEEVIFAGTASRKSRGMAEVTLVIDNQDGALPIDFSEVAITRRMFRSGESEYSINGVPCRLRDIRELIMDTGIGVDGYSLIGQGKIADIVSGKPESRREIFEEAAGIVKYRTKKAEAERKLDVAAQNLHRVNDIIGEIESRIEGLQQESQRASEYLELNEKYKALEINITLKNIENTQKRVQEAKQRIQEFQQQLIHKRNEKELLEKEAAEGNSLLQDVEERQRKTTDSYLTLRDKTSELQRKIESNREKRQSLEQQIEQLNKDAAGLSEKIQKEKQELDIIYGKGILAENKKEAMEDLLAQRTKEYEEESTALREQMEKADSGKNALFQWNIEISKKTTEMDSIGKLQETLVKRKAQLLETKSEADPDPEGGKSLKEIYEDAIDNVESIRESIENHGQKLRDARADVNGIETELRKLNSRIAETGNAISQRKTRKRILEELEDSYEGYNHGVKFIMNSGLPGIEGVVAELITVPRGYEIAIETALGASLQNIVCREDSHGKAAINLLKKEKAGRLTFLPMESIRSRNTTLKTKDREKKGLIGVASECIEFDKKYQSIMDYLLGKIIIAQDIDHATDLSKTIPGGFRYVTLEGEVINTSGAMTGGMYKNSSAGILERRTTLDQLEGEILEMEGKAGILGKSRRELEGKRDRQEGSIAKLQAQLREEEIRLAGEERALESMKKRLDEHLQREERWSREFFQNENHLRETESLIEQLKKEILQLRGQLQALENDTEAQINQHQEKQKRVDSLKAECEQLKRDVIAIEGEKGGLDQLAARIVEDVNQLLEELEENKRRRSQMEQQLKGLGGSVEAVEGELESHKIHLTQLETLLKELAEEKILHSKRQHEIAILKEDEDKEIFQLQTKKYELDLTFSKDEEQLEHMKNQLWEDFEISYLQAIDFKNRDFNMAQGSREAKRLKSQLKAIGPVNLGSIEEYKTVSERYEFLRTQREDLNQAAESLTQIIINMDRSIKTNFRKSFQQINEAFQEIFCELFSGGRAHVEMKDESQPLESSIEIIAQPPGKKLQNMNLLSGGEKTMTAIALMFAILKVRPTPFCILDEVEAALDEANIDRFADYLKKFNKIQFILVTHQKVTMEHADVLYGVTMPEKGISRILSLRLADEAVAN